MYKNKRDKIGIGYESLHVMALVSVQCLQVDEVIPILSPAVYCGFGRCGSQRFTWWHCIKSIQLVPKATI